MSKICPNCLRPVRTGANYCGFCGTSLIPVARNTSSSMPTSQDYVDNNVRATSAAQPNPKRNKASRPWVITPIILLFLVILLALVVRFWPEIIAYLALTLASIKLP